MKKLCVVAAHCFAKMFCFLVEKAIKNLCWLVMKATQICSQLQLKRLSTFVTAQGRVIEQIESFMKVQPKKNLLRQV